MEDSFPDIPMGDTVMNIFHCQLHWIFNYLGNTPLAMPGYVSRRV